VLTSVNSRSVSHLAAGFGADSMPSVLPPAPFSIPPAPNSLTPQAENTRPQSCPNATRPAPVDVAILTSGELEIQALERATNLPEVIKQLERGDVQRIRDMYGPQQGRNVA
jgi:hypothetical protein